MGLFSVWLLALWFASASALQASQAGVVDWHKSFIGVPRTGALSTAPIFHRTGGPNESTQSVILTATASDVLAALHPVDGSVAWRHISTAEDHVVGLKAHEDVLATLSGPGGATLRLFDVLSGDLLAEKSLHPPVHGHLFEPETLGTAITFGNDDDVFALSDGCAVRRLNTKSGELKWTWTSPDETSLVVFSKLVVASSEVYVVGLAKSFASYTLHLTVLSLATGEVLESASIPSNVKGGLSDFIVISNAKQPLVFPHVIWFEAGSVRVLKLTPELKEKPNASKGAVYKRIMDIGLSEHGQFVSIKEDGTGHAFRLNEDGLKAVWEFKDSATSSHYAESHYVGGLDKDGLPYIARVFWSHVQKKASAHVYASHLADGRGLVTGHTFPFESSIYGVISHVNTFAF